MSQFSLENAVLNEVCPSGESWMGKVKRGQIFRILDLEGNQAVDTLFYNAHDASERYSASDTIRRQQQLYLEKGSALYSNLGQVMLRMIDDTCGRHDTLGGACAAESNCVRYSIDKRHMHSCRDNFMHAIAHHPYSLELGLSKRDITSNINFFMNVPVSANGDLHFADGISGAGKYVDLQAEMDIVVLISNCPQLNNPCNAYNPTPIRLLVWDAA